MKLSKANKDKGKKTQIQFKRGNKLSLSIETLSEEGHGVALTKGFEFRVAGAAPGDQIEARISHISPHKKVVWADLIKAYYRGDDFIRPTCHHAAPTRGKCGGCPLMHLTNDSQNYFKLQQVNRALTDLIDNHKIKLNSASPTLGYRNRAHFVVTANANKRIRLGSYEPRSHRVARMDGCQTARPIISDTAKWLETTLTEKNIPVYPQKDGLRYLTLRANHQKKLLVELIHNGNKPKWLKPLVLILSQRQEILGISASVNESTGNAMRVAPARALHGADCLPEKVGKITLWASADSFTQLHSDMAVKIYQRAAEWAGSVKNIWDLYCGIGGFGLTLAASKNKSVLLKGAESHPAAVAFAKKSALTNKLKGIFKVSDLSKGWPDFMPLQDPPDIILVNPPRRGLDGPVLEALGKCKTPVIYMSCNPHSFARDVKQLQKSGRTLKKVEAFDMLPQTRHVELLGLL